jgi:D-amino-acid dehydrogenase
MRHVAVIGAGIVGATTAIALAKRGLAVTIIEPGTPGGPQAASHGNGAWISPASVVPMAMPGLWRKVPGMLADPLGPLTIRWSALPALLPWLTAFLRAGATVARVEATARALTPLLFDAPARHAALAREAGCTALIRQDGLLYAYPDRAAFVAEGLPWRLRRDVGVAWEELDGAALARLQPALAARYGFGILVGAGAHCTDPGAYVAALVRHALAAGVRLVQAPVTGFRLGVGAVQAVRTGAGEIACDAAVIAAGIRSGAIARMLGDRVPLASERGYHVEIADAGIALAMPVMPSDGKMANTALDGRLRAAGQVELATIDAAPDWRRATILLKHLKATWPSLDRDIPEERISTWMGHRPSTPDGLPVIGRSRRIEGIIHAFGHGHVGLAAAPATAEIVADLMSGADGSIDPAPYAPHRFR